MSEETEEVYNGAFGTITREGDLAIKRTLGFRPTIQSGDKPSPHMRDLFQRDRESDLMQGHPFALPTISVCRRLDEIGEEDELYHTGLEIRMPWCSLTYLDKSGNVKPLDPKGPGKQDIPALGPLGEESEPEKPKGPNIGTLFHWYKEIDKKFYTNPEWIAFVGETILNLAISLESLHNADHVHVDVRDKNVFVHANQPLEGRVEELAEKARVFLGDRGGKNVALYIYARDKKKGGSSQTGFDTLSQEKTTRIGGLYIDGQFLPHQCSDQRLKLYDLQLLGALAGYLLTGDDIIRNRMDAKDADLDEYIGLNSTLSNAPGLIQTIRKTGKARANLALKQASRPYKSVGEFITDLQSALSEFFYVVKRSHLPYNVQDELGSGESGYVVCTPDRFMRLMYVGRRLSEQALGDALRVSKNAYQQGNVRGATNVSITMPRSKLVGSSGVTPALASEIMAEQKEYLEQTGQDITVRLGEARRRHQAAGAEIKQITEEYEKNQVLLRRLSL